MKNGFLIAMAVVMGTMPSRPAQASTITFGWLSANIQSTFCGLSSPQTKNGGLTAPGNLNQPATAGPDLYAQNGGAGETGLGMTTDPAGDHELSATLNDGAPVDFSRATADAPKGPATMTISSAPSGEDNGSDSNPTDTVMIDGALAIATTAAPEPGSLIMAGSALIAIGIVLKKVQKKA